MAVPSGAPFGCGMRLHELYQDLAVRGIRHAEIAVEEEVAQSITAPWRLARLHVREQRAGLIEHDFLRGVAP